MDGWGIGDKSNSDAIHNANTPFVDSLYHKYPNAELNTSGEEVGLPDGQMGNSEVGHLNIGAGRVVYQDLVKINLAAENGEFAHDPTLQAALAHARATGGNIHITGLLSDGGVHAHINHAKALCSWLYAEAFENVFVHAFTDGRDTDPNGGVDYLQDLMDHMDATTGRIASVIGRYYAMDRDKRWERVARAYNLLVNGKGAATDHIVEAVKAQYAAGTTDEFMEPIFVANDEGTPLACIKENDVVLVFNFRTDRGREITEVLTQRDFPEHNMSALNLHYVTMTSYDDTFKGVEVVFRKDNLSNTLGEVLETAGKTQIRIAETEKYPHVTFFFSGGREEPFEGEERLLCPSPKVATYDLQPEMSAADLRDALIPELEKEEVDFVCLNFANPDMVGHTGVFSAVVKAVETVDACAEAVVTAGLAHGYSFIIIADHGNADVMMNEDGSPNTAHSTNLVPCILVDKNFKPELRDGKLGDVSPTILKLMGVTQPKEITGVALF